MRRGLNWDRRAEKIQELRGNNLEILKKELKLNAKTLSVLLGYDEGGVYLSQIKTGARPFSEELARRTEKVTGVADRWLDLDSPPVPIPRRRGGSVHARPASKFPITEDAEKPDGRHKVAASLMDAVHTSIGAAIRDMKPRGITQDEMLNLVHEVFRSATIVGEVDDESVRRSIAALIQKNKVK